MIPEITDIAWAAGFFDGEGSTTLYSKPRKSMDTVRIPVMSITQVNRTTLERFQRIVFELGRLYGPYYRKKGKPQHLWRTTKLADAQAVASLLWKFLTPEKQAQITRSFAAYKQSISSGRLCWAGLHQKPRRYGKCKECAAAAIRRWRQKPEVRERLKAYRRRYESENPHLVARWQEARRKRKAGQ
jgi:hypothetical protein